MHDSLSVYSLKMLRTHSAMVLTLLIPKLYSLIIPSALNNSVETIQFTNLETENIYNYTADDSMVNQNTSEGINFDENLDDFMSNETHQDDDKNELSFKKSLLQMQTLLGFNSLYGTQFLSQSFERNVILPQFMDELYHSIVKAGDEKQAKPHGAEEVWSLLEKDPSKNDNFKFSLNGLSDEEEIIEAELQIYRIGVDQQIGYPPYYLLRVYQIMPNKMHSLYLNPDLHQLLNVHYISAFATGWQVFKVKRAVISWLKGVSPNMGLLVTATTILGEPVDIRFARRGLHSDVYQPTLVLFTKNKNKKHTEPIQLNIDTKKDTKPDSANNSHTTMCNKEELKIHFSDIGWNKNIILPISYDLGQCSGSCESSVIMENGRNYGYVQSALQELGLVEFKSPCCVPIILKGLTIVYVDLNSNIVLKTIANMKIDTCGCR